MEVLVIALCLAYVLRDPAATLKAAAEYRRARQVAPAHAPRSRPGALRGFLWTVWDTHWNEAARRYPERMARARKRREQRRAKREQERGWGGPSRPAPAPVGAAAGPSGARVIDLAQRRTARTQPGGGPAEPAKTPPAPQATTVVPETTAEPAETPPAPLGAEPATAPPPEGALVEAAAGEAVPEGVGTTTKEEMVDLSDSATLSAHLGALGSQADYLDRVSSDMERLAAGMRAHDMGEAVVGAVDAAREAEREAAAALRAAAEALRAANAGVAEAYAAHRDAADGHYQTGHR